MQMTDRQRQVIGYIEENLQIQYTGEDDKKSASAFIQKHIEASKEAAKFRNRSIFDGDADEGWEYYSELFMPNLPGDVMR